MTNNASKMRIAYLLDNFPVISETFVSDEIFSVVEAGINVHVFSFTPPSADVVHPRAEKIVASGRMRHPNTQSALNDLMSIALLFVKRPLPTLRTLALAIFAHDLRWKARASLAFAREMLALGITHIHVHFAATQAVQMALWISRWTEIPFTFTTHGYDIFRLPPSNMRELTDASAGMVCVTNYNINYLVDRFALPREKLALIRCGIYVEQFRGNIRVPDVNAKRIVLLSVARLESVKGHHYLLQAVRLLKDRHYPVELRLVGDGSLRQNLETQADELGIKSVVYFMGSQPADVVRDQFRDCDIAVLPSVHESMGVVNMEAMASGRPVIATAVLGVPELVEDRVTGFLCPPGDPMAIADTVEWILKNPDATSAIVEGGMKRVLNDFNRANCTKQLIKFWEQAPSAPRSS